MVFKQIEDSLTTGEFNGIISLFRKHSPISYEVELQDNITTPYGNIELNLEDTILLDTGILISEETILAEPSILLKAPTFPHSNYTLTLDVIHYTGANIFDTTPTSNYEVKDTITLTLPPNTSVPIPVENLQKDYIISLNAQLSITHDKTVITGRPPVLTLNTDKTILSAYDGDKATLTAYYTQDDNPITDTTVTFYSNGTSIGTSVTDSNGEATLTYTAIGAGDIIITAKADTTTSNTKTITDTIIHNTTQQTFTSSSTLVNSAMYSNIFDVANTNFEMTYDIKTNGLSGGLNIGASTQYTPPSSANYRLFIGGDGENASFNNRTTTSSNSTQPMSHDEWHTLKIIKNGTNITGYVDATTIATKTVTWLGDYNQYDLYWINWGDTNYCKNILIKKLGTLPHSILLASDKQTIESAETATITATVTDENNIPVSDVLVSFYKGTTLLGTDTTDINGEATVTYTGTGAGKLTIQAECMNITGTYTLIDALFYDKALAGDGNHRTDWTNNGITATYSDDGTIITENNSGSGKNYVANFTAIEDVIIEFDATGITVPSNSVRFYYKGADNYLHSYLSDSTLHHFKFVCENGTVTPYIDDVQGTVRNTTTNTTCRFILNASSIKFKDFKIYTI